jgi:hypothetical protein
VAVLAVVEINLLRVREKRPKATVSMIFVYLRRVMSFSVDM